LWILFLLFQLAEFDLTFYDCAMELYTYEVCILLVTGMVRGQINHGTMIDSNATLHPSLSEPSKEISLDQLLVSIYSPVNLYF